MHLNLGEKSQVELTASPKGVTLSKNKRQINEVLSCSGIGTARAWQNRDHCKILEKTGLLGGYCTYGHEEHHTYRNTAQENKGWAG